LKDVSLPDTTIESAVVDPGNETVPASCRVTAITTHPPAGDKIKIWIALPMKNWNGRFQGVGGGGFSGGSANGVVQPLRAGYAAGSTDTGHDGGSGSFALGKNGHLDWQLIRDNAYLGIHEMTVTGKALAQAFYGAAPAKAYWNGCSTGGRQGLSEAQRYPADYDGILAGAPAINWTKLHVEQMWATVVMLDLNYVIAPCKYIAATQAAIAACDMNDGVKDGRARGSESVHVRPEGAGRHDDGLRRIRRSGRGRDPSDLGRAETARRIVPLVRTHARRRFQRLVRHRRHAARAAPERHHRRVVEVLPQRRPAVVPADIDARVIRTCSGISRSSSSAACSRTDNPDLSAFKARGGKIVMWHGQSDPLIYPGGSIDYYTGVQKAMGGADKTSDFYRLYLAPGVGHCGGGAGPAPSGQFEAVVRWVEEGKAPDTLDAVRRDQSGATARSRVLCPYPATAHYKGNGSTDEARSFECRTR
jgi:feruloyl esterase